MAFGFPGLFEWGLVLVRISISVPKSEQKPLQCWPGSRKNLISTRSCNVYCSGDRTDTYGDVPFRNGKQELQMDVSKILEELRQEREQLEEAILSLERLARGRGRRRGRPPSWMVEAKKRGRPVGSKNKVADTKSATHTTKTSTAAA
jgi:hypothetical protein